MSLFTVGLGGQDCSFLIEPGELIQPPQELFLDLQECPEATEGCCAKFPTCFGHQQVIQDLI